MPFFLHCTLRNLHLVHFHCPRVFGMHRTAFFEKINSKYRFPKTSRDRKTSTSFSRPAPREFTKVFRKQHLYFPLHYSCLISISQNAVFCLIRKRKRKTHVWVVHGEQKNEIVRHINAIYINLLFTRHGSTETRLRTQYCPSFHTIR